MPGTTNYTDASINAAGDLVVESQDLGELPMRVWGDSDYETWVTVRTADKMTLLQRLQESTVANTLAGDEDEVLLGLVKEKFGGRASASSDLRKWLDEQAIVYAFASYA